MNFYVHQYMTCINYELFQMIVWVMTGLGICHNRQILSHLPYLYFQYDNLLN